MRIRILPFIILFIFSGFSLLAQSPADSLLIVKNKWKKQKIAKGLVWKQSSFDGLFGSKQEVNILEVDLNNKLLQVDIAGVSKGLKKTSQFADEEMAIAAINGSFFDTKIGGSVTYIKRNGEIINQTSMNTKEKVNERANAALLIDEANHRVSIVGADMNDILWEEKLDYPTIMVCGPLLLIDKNVVSLASNPFNNNRHPRSAVAITSTNKLLLITVDGRNKNAQGMNLNELAFFLKTIGSKSALNLDGGGSTSLYLNAKKKKGIINYPSDNKLFDHEGERSVANVILIKKK